jgi:hypothetical protein
MRSKAVLISLMVCFAALLIRVSLAAPRLTYVVTTTADSGAGSLRQAILDANLTPDIDNIVFDIPGTPPFTILLESGLPVIYKDNGGLEINGGTRGSIIIDGSDTFNLFFSDGATLILKHLVLQNGASDEGGAVHNVDGFLTVEDTLIDSSTANLKGGGIYNLGGVASILNSTISNNSAEVGGGIYHDGYGLTVLQTEIIGNTAVGEEGGGGLALSFNFFGEGGTYIISSLILGNTTTNPTIGRGGGVHHINGTATIFNSTLSNNFSANATDTHGAGILVSGGTLNILNTTIADHDNPVNGDGLEVLGGTANVGNTIIANNADVNCAGNITNLGSNLEFPGSTCGFPVQDPLLLPLADNGGFTQTYALAENSPAVDAGNNTLVLPDFLDVDGDANPEEPFPFDQRGSIRISLSTVDIGAFEVFQGVPTPTPTAPAFGELLVNGHFEQAEWSGNPTGWTIKNGTGDKRKCSEDTDSDGIPDKIVAHSGECAFQFKGSAGERSKLQQTVDLTTLPLTQSSVLQVRAYVKAPGTPNAKLKLRIKYSDGTDTRKTVLEINAPTGIYTLLTADLGFASLALDNARVSFDNRAASGKLWIDDASLIVITGTPIIELPLP